MTKLAHKFEPINFNSIEIGSFSEIMLSLLTIEKSDSQTIMCEKLNALKSFRDFLEQFIQFKKLETREAKNEYIEFASNLNQQIEYLQIQTGERTLESIQRAGRRFAKKTQFPLGIILE
jgi:hypothetical protein